MARKIKERVKKHIKRIMETKTSPHPIALGFSIGTFIAILPTYGFHILIAFLVALIIKGINKISLFAAIAVWNPITLIPVYVLSYMTGDFVLGFFPEIEYYLSTLSKFYHYSGRFLLGNFILAVLISILMYGIIWGIVSLYQKFRQSKDLNTPAIRPR